MTVCAKLTRESSAVTETRARLFSVSGRSNPTITAKRALGLDDKKCNELSSNESLTHVRSARNVQLNDQKGDVRHVFSTNRNHNFKNDRIILLTNKVPFYTFSNIPFSKESRASTR